jgi:transcriptional regulator with XRE-family HTH domain
MAKKRKGGRKAIDESTRKRCGDRLRRARIEAGYETIGDAEAATGLSYQQLYDWESGKRIPCMDNLDRLVSLGYPRSVLFPDKPKRRGV